MAFDQHRQLVDQGHFAMTAKGDIPRSTFNTTHTYKTTFDAGYLVPVLAEEVLPGDVHRGQVTIFARLSTPLFPIMDSLFLESFFFFVPNRLIWDNWKKMMGEQKNPGDSIAFTTPQLVSAAGGFVVGSIYDYFGLPTVGQVGGGNTISVNALPFRAYNYIWGEWFRDENLQNIPNNAYTTGDSGDVVGAYALLRRGKKHDYFTSCLPFPSKVTDLGLLSGLKADINGIAIKTGLATSAASSSWLNTGGGTPVSLSWPAMYLQSAAADAIAVRAATSGSSVSPNVYADLGTASGFTINALRLAYSTQLLAEKDARSGTRYTELLRAHFGVTPEDSRLQRPEYIGGGHTTIQTSAIPQTSATGLTGGSSPLGALGAAATAADSHEFSYHATEHGWIIGLVNVNAELTYQQGLHKKWTRLTRYDHYWPAFAHLGEQAVLLQEIYAVGNGASGDTQVFGYQERWAEYKYRPSQITGLFRSTSAGTIDPWHLSQKFTSAPALNSTFIQDTPPMSRVLAAGAAANGMQILFDSVWNINTTRAMPMYSIPGWGSRL